MVPETAPRAAPSRRPWAAPFVRFWRSRDPRLSAVRDVVVAGLVVALLLSGVWIYTGQPFPKQAPLVVVESGSMMHGPYGPCLRRDEGCAAFGRPAFGRIGTIDPGDLVLVKRTNGLEGISTAFGPDARLGYGGHGDVVVYKKPDPLFPTPVIHRALLLVHVDREGCLPGGAPRCVYTIPETCDAHFGSYVRAGAGDWTKYCKGSPDPITFDLERDGIFLRLFNYPCEGACGHRFYSGLITKGDNNQIADQPWPYPGDQERSTAIACCPIRGEWILGKARGELPWFGLIKLAIYGNEIYLCGDQEPCSDPTRESQWTFFKATAPWDIWVMLFIAIGVLIAAPVVADVVARRIRAARHPPAKRDPPPPPVEAPRDGGPGPQG